MGRRKLEIKRIEDKNSRQVTFTKRRGGLFKKARHLSALCEADIAVVVFSSRGKLHEFSSGGGSVRQILSRYQKNCSGAEASTIAGADQVAEPPSQFTNFTTCKELLETVERCEEPNAEGLPATDLVQLEGELAAALMQTRSRKNQLMMEYISTLNEKETTLREENKQMEQEAALTKEIADRDDGGSGVNDLATNWINGPQLLTLPLFTR